MTEPSSILVVFAHPDDVDFGAAGSVAAWTDAGIAVSYCVVTDGDAGGAGTGIPRHEMAAIRRAEQTRAAAAVGVTDLYWLGHPDGMVVASIELRRDITRVIRRVRPDRVVSPSPDRLLDRIYASHPDHLAVGEATLCAVYPDARNAWAFPELLESEGLAPHAVPEVYLMAHHQATDYVDITGHIDRKIEALLSHQSQISDPESMAPRMKAWAATMAEAAGLPDGHLAEGFLRVSTA